MKKMAAALMALGGLWSHASAVGVIGGADGPTVIMVTGSFGWLWIPAAMIAAVILAVWIVRRRKKG